MTHGSKEDIAQFESLLEEPSVPIPGRAPEGEPGAPSWWTEDGDGFDEAFARFGSRPTTR